jgi:hypothetical protein
MSASIEADRSIRMSDKQSSNRPQDTKPKPAGKQEATNAEEARLANYAATQAGGDGIEGDVAKPDKTEDEKLGAQMPDRK